MTKQINKKYRVMYVQKFSGGGSILSLYELLRKLDKKKFEPVVIFYEQNDYYEKFKKLGIELITLNHKTSSSKNSNKSTRDISENLRTLGNWLANSYTNTKQIYLFAKKDLPVCKKIFKIIKEKKIDLIHHNNSLYGNRSTIFASRLLKIPQVCHVRMFHNLSLVEKHLSKYVNNFFYISKAIEDSYCNQGISVRHGNVVYNPIKEMPKIDNEVILKLRRELGLNKNELLITNVGRIERWKGQDYFLRAFAELIKTGANVKALIVGAPNNSFQDSEYYQDLLRLVSQLQISNKVIFAGFRNDVPIIMAASDILVHSSSEPEPFGRVIGEGMLAAKPVVASAAGGVLEIIEDHVTGLLVPIKDSSKMAYALLSLIKNPCKAYKIGQNAYKISRKKFSVELHTSIIEKKYFEILTAQ